MKTLLTTFDEVIDILGGVKKVAELVDRSPSAVCNWRRTKGRFPTAQYFVMQKALAALDCTAPRALWGFFGEDSIDDLEDVA
jgi:hypothetical protein